MNALLVNALAIKALVVLARGFATKTRLICCLRVGALLLAGLGLVACETVNLPRTQLAYPAEIERLLSGERILGQPVKPEDLPNLDLFEITPEMAAFAKNAVRHKETYYERVRALHIALLSTQERGGQGISYSAYTTEVPKVTFESRKANCLSFTLLYASLARYLGIDASINAVEIPPTWDLRNKKDMVFLRHVNVRIPMIRDSQNAFRADDVIIDLEMNRYSSAYPQRDIDDITASAQFYSNRSMEFMEQNDMRNSFLYLRKAIALNGQQSYLWSNLGAVYGRFKLYKEAEQAYNFGLQINPNDLTIMNNLAYLYQHTGNKAGAAKYLKLAQRYRDSNPYYQYTLAVSAYEQNQYETSLDYLKRALIREKKEIRFYELGANIYQKLGYSIEEAAMQKKIKKLKPTRPVSSS